MLNVSRLGWENVWIPVNEKRYAEENCICSLKYIWTFDIFLPRQGRHAPNLHCKRATALTLVVTENGGQSVDEGE
jgi:hypothetical protein